MISVFSHISKGQRPRDLFKIIYLTPCALIALSCSMEITKAQGLNKSTIIAFGRTSDTISFIFSMFTLLPPHARKRFNNRTKLHIFPDHVSFISCFPMLQNGNNEKIPDTIHDNESGKIATISIYMFDNISRTSRADERCNKCGVRIKKNKKNT